MNITINTDILKKHNLTLGEFLVMLLSYFELDYKWLGDLLIGKDLANKDLFKDGGFILSDNSKNLVARILMESDEKAIKSGIDFDSLAVKLQELYPEGNKSGTTYSWRGDADEIAQKLRILVVKHNFLFTEEEALSAVKEYVESYASNRQEMSLLKYFILKTSAKRRELSSPFMTIIENHR